MKCEKAMFKGHYIMKLCGDMKDSIGKGSIGSSAGPYTRYYINRKAHGCNFKYISHCPFCGEPLDLSSKFKILESGGTYVASYRGDNYIRVTDKSTLANTSLKEFESELEAGFIWQLLHDLEIDNVIASLHPQVVFKSGAHEENVKTLYAMIGNNSLGLLEVLDENENHVLDWYSSSEFKLANISQVKENVVGDAVVWDAP